jgi:O-antigen/teichoic acid export membrane protein
LDFGLASLSLVRRNVIANYASQGWMAVMTFVFVPFYLKFIGAEGYGLVGFFVLLSSTLALADGGLGATATRQAAAIGESDERERAGIVVLLRSIEALFWAAALVIGVVVALAAPLVATHWLNVEDNQVPDVVVGLKLMAVALLLGFPIAFYSGCLIGLQRQVPLSFINAVSATMRGLGATLILWLVAPTIQAFFAWQCVVGLITVVWLRGSLGKTLRRAPGTPWFSVSALRSVGRFTGEMWGINVLSFLLTQVDKIILSRILTLQTFGYYMLAWTLGTFAYRLTQPIFSAYYPRITELVIRERSANLVSVGSTNELVDFYLKAGRIMAVAIVPFSVWVAFFGHDLLLWWTRDPAIAAAASGAVAFIALGTMCNGLMHVPYGLQLASGWTSLAFWQNLAAVVFVLPLTAYFAIHHGLTGAAFPWLLLNATYVVISAPLMYRVLLKDAKWTWYRTSVIYPIFQATLLIALFYYAATRLLESPAALVVTFSGLFATVGVSLLSSGLVRTRPL